MTLEQLAMYLWHDMPLTGWGVVLSVVLTLAGIVIYLDGKTIMQANSSYTKTVAVTDAGESVEYTSSSIGPGYHSGRSLARLGLAISIFALISYVSLMRGF